MKIGELAKHSGLNPSRIRFYEARGFALVRQTDGAGYEEKEPDALYLWTRCAAA